MQVAHSGIDSKASIGRSPMEDEQVARAATKAARKELGHMFIRQDLCRAALKTAYLQWLQATTLSYQITGHYRIA